MSTSIRYPNRYATFWGTASNAMAPAFRAGDSQASGDTRTPALNIREGDADYVVEAELPGIDKSTLDITVNEGVLRIAADTNPAAPDSGGDRLLRQERITGRFARELRLGAGIDEANISAEYRDGIVLLTLPKTAEVQPKKVNVKIH
jgi:HSP20 family molecular chaperone IbpA